MVDLEAVINKVREYIDFWIATSVHASEQFHTHGASQDVEELTRRCLEGAKTQGISETDMKAEIGNVAKYIRSRLKAANEAEIRRQKPG